MQRFGGRMGNVPPVVLRLLILNVVMYILTYLLQGRINLGGWLALYSPGSEYFQPYQLITHMFMHANFYHLFFNMFALWMFGRVLENVWGGKRFFVYYFITGLGAAGLQLLVNYIQDVPVDIPMLGASGAVFGVLLAFGMLFPNTRLMLIFPPIPIKAKWFVMIYGAAELYFGIANYSKDPVAHFAHLGGMIFGFILIKYWNKTNRKNFY